jgi:hypothetical protein
MWATQQTWDGRSSGRQIGSKTCSRGFELDGLLPTLRSPFLLVTRKTAHTGEPVSQFWMNRLFRSLPVTAEQLRDDRIVEEALSGRADPLHLAAVFGFGPRTGLRYAQAARDAAESGLRRSLSGDADGDGSHSPVGPRPGTGAGISTRRHGSLTGLRHDGPAWRGGTAGG